MIVLDISANLCSIYQICHSRDGKIIQFSPNNVVVRDPQDLDTIVSYGKVAHGSHLYRFVGFETSSGRSFIAHAESLSKIWHERY